MAATYNSPPGWPQPPEGWSPPPGWQPDPSWPAPPEGWQFWTDDSAPGEGASGPQGEQTPEQPVQQPQPGYDPNATQQLAQQPGQQGPSGPQGPPTSSMPALYSYGPSSGLEQPGQSPYDGGRPGGPQGPYPQGPYPQGGYQPGGGYATGAPPTQPTKNRAPLIIAVVVGVLLLGGLIWGVSALVGQGGDEPSPTVAPPTASEATDDPTTDAPTDEPTDEPTDAPTDEPTDEPTDAPPSGEYVDLAGDEPAVVAGLNGDPVVEVRLLSVEQDWQPGSGTFGCSEPENGSYMVAELEYTTLDALAEEDPPTYTETGFNVGAEGPSGVADTNPFTGLFCLDAEDQLPSEMAPGETYTGLVLLDVPDDVTAVTYANFFDLTGTAPTYRWVLADQ